MHACTSPALLVLTLCGGVVGCSLASITDSPDAAATVSPGTDGDPFSPANDELDGSAKLRDDGVDVSDRPAADASAHATSDATSDARSDAAPPTAPAGTCADPSSIRQVVDCITDRMPREDSDRYTIPSGVLATAWRGVIRQMLSGACANITIPSELAGTHVAPFRDWENGRTYCVLQEIEDKNGDGYVDRGFGTFIVDPAAERELVHSAPHPFSDETTEMEAVTIFRETRSRAFLLTGVHRRASNTRSTCQADYFVSDAAHEDSHLFHAATAELAAHYGTAPWTEIQWHGMAADTCPGVNAYMTYGVSAAPAADSQLVALRNAMRAAHPSWALHMPGTAACSMGGTSNVQGRLLNQVASDQVCGTSTKTSYGRFIHIEQQPGHRNPNDWIAAVKTAFPGK